MKGDEDRRRNQTARVEVRRMGRSGKKVRRGDDGATSEEEREIERTQRQRRRQQQRTIKGVD